jgi:serine phosphatase RsbU (regulator of sigma subunit)
VLVPLPGKNAPPREPLPIDSTVPGNAFRQVTSFQTSSGGCHRLWLPLLDSVERLGIVEAVAQAPFGAELRQDCTVVTHLLAELVVTRSAYGDTQEITRRREGMDLSAEIIWNLLPPLTFATGRVTITGILEPWHKVGGDAFDYAVAGDTAHVAVFDAMGHGLHASLLATIALGAYRRARRLKLDVLGTYQSIDQSVRAEFPDNFLTGILADLDLSTGNCQLVCAGHPAALLFRHGRLVKTLSAPTALPFGLGDADARVVTEALEPDDRLLLYTDGIVEARTGSGELFGLTRLVDFVTRSLSDKLPAPEAMRRLVRAILEYQAGNLQDDATALFVEWRHAPNRSRTAAGPRLWPSLP